MWRFTSHPGGDKAALRLSEDYALRARTELDVDNPSIERLQTCLLLSLAFSATGQGRKAYMLFCKSTIDPIAGNGD